MIKIRKSSDISENEILRKKFNDSMKNYVPIKKIEYKQSKQESRKIENCITVKELIDILKKYDENFYVFTQGCDCVGEANGCELINENIVLINRLLD